MKVNFYKFTDKEKELFLKIWKEKGFYIESENVESCFCTPWDWYGDTLEADVKPGETLEDIMPRIVNKFYGLYLSEIAKYQTEYFKDIAKGFVRFPDCDQIDRDLSAGEALARDLAEFGYKAESLALLAAMDRAVGLEVQGA